MPATIVSFLFDCSTANISDFEEKKSIKLREVKLNFLSVRYELTFK